MSKVYFITHPDVVIDPSVPVEDWSLSVTGLSRMQKMLTHRWMLDIKSVHSSTEKKAVDGAGILAEFLNLQFTQHAGLGENDRRSTGYLPAQEFESVADLFFAKPLQSVRGWETAQHAQGRVVQAFNQIVESVPHEHSVAIVSHGAVGALLLCHLNGWPIDRKHDQPGSGGGNFFCVEKKTHEVIHGWQPIDSGFA